MRVTGEVIGRSFRFPREHQPVRVMIRIVEALSRGTDPQRFGRLHHKPTD